MDVSLIWDWLTSRESGDVLAWWLLATLAGAAVWPLLFRVLGALPDRGYTLARAAGLMLTGFIFWFLASLGLLRNTPGGMVFAWGVMLVLALIAFLRWDRRPDLRAWWREHRALVITTELVFLVLLFVWAIYRAHNPEMRSTEKPMEIMFINGIRASETFPPHDSWLAGYAISYYYFGYVIVAMLADLSGVSSGIAFNITNALLFALAGIGALGVVYNLVRARGLKVYRREHSDPGATMQPPGGKPGPAIAAGLLAMVFLIWMGNLGAALVEFPYRGWTPGLVNADYFDFWDIEARAGSQPIAGADGLRTESPPDRDLDGVPDWDDDRQPLDGWGFWGGIGWRYSRVVHDRDLHDAPVGAQPITEFPNFSFVLSDNHPHVLALPFALLAIGLALNLVLGGRALLRWEYPLYTIWVGGMVFMNSWDAIYLLFLVGAEVLRRLVWRGDGTLGRDDLLGVLRFAAILAGLTALLYAPWLISFTSQAGGILPNVIYPTPWQQFFLQFGTFLVILAIFLAVEWRRAGGRFNPEAGLMAGAGGLVAGFLVVAILGVSAWNSNTVRHAVFGVWETGDGLGALADDIFARRLIGLPSALLMFGMIGVVVGRLFARAPSGSVADADLSEREIGPDGAIRLRAINFSPATGFALLLVGAGAVLTIAPDFVYLRDNFAVRINTVFKLYYQGWLMFSLAAGFAVWSVLDGGETVRKRKPKWDPGEIAGATAFGAVVTVLLLAGLLYPFIAMHGRAIHDHVDGYAPGGRLSIKERAEACDESLEGVTCPELPPLTLDGTSFMVSAAEYEAVQCLDALEDDPDDAVLVEAPCHCGYHPEIGRFSALTGIPTLFGWGNHEGQWRGETLPELIDTRFEDGQRRDRYTDLGELYSTLDWARAWALIDRYDVDYVVVGPAEAAFMSELAGDDPARQREYSRGLDKFAAVMEPVCSTANTTVYRVRPE